jgi:hypothetical protein
MEVGEAGMTISIPLSQGFHALIDDEDYDLVSSHKWYVKPGPRPHYASYALTSIDGRTIYMHRLLLGFPQGLCVDHANGDGLDNRRSNLRLATASQNAANSQRQDEGKFRGISRDRRPLTRPFRAYVGHGAGRWRGKRRATPEEAARDYDVEARRRYGEFARLNFPQGEGA